MLVTIVIRPPRPEGSHPPRGRITSRCGGEVEDGSHRSVRVLHRPEVAACGPELQGAVGQPLDDLDREARRDRGARLAVGDEHPGGPPGAPGPQPAYPPPGVPPGPRLGG